MTAPLTPTLEPCPGSAARFAATRGGAPLSVAEVLDAWAAGDEWYGAALAARASRAFHWEHPAWTPASLDAPYECAVVDSPSLARETADPRDFAAPLAAAGGAVATFPNLGHDALLVVPAARSAHDHYGHLASFVRGAPRDQRADLWRAVAAAVRGRLGARPVWLSTAGLGVPWLHVRLDDRPKYYRHAPYRESP